MYVCVSESDTEICTHMYVVYLVCLVQVYVRCMYLMAAVDSTPSTETLDGAIKPETVDWSLSFTIEVPDLQGWGHTVLVNMLRDAWYKVDSCSMTVAGS